MLTYFTKHIQGAREPRLAHLVCCLKEHGYSEDLQQGFRTALVDISVKDPLEVSDAEKMICVAIVSFLSTLPQGTTVTDIAEMIPESL
jgi:hypothetical protein